ncbi:MAG: hypothetical protein C0606_07650 [Hyphomicrobiales bacterium]|nr:MAG: hypothetical protein C0606_07650 [Hyphomicrobiales bacterium]
MQKIYMLPAGGMAALLIREAESRTRCRDGGMRPAPDSDAGCSDRGNATRLHIVDALETQS